MNRETDADEFFRVDAERLGYLAPDGEGLWQYYTDHGMIPPEKLERRDRGPVILTGWDFDGDLQATDITGERIR